METGLGSPRSSSGYGSSEEDHHGCSATGRRRRATFAQYGGAIPIPASGGSTGSSPQTPQSLSPSETGSSLNSPNPFSIDFRSVFDDADLAGMPDFTDLAAFATADALDDVELPADLWPGEMETWANELDRAGYVPTKPASQVDNVAPTKRPDKRQLRDDSQILVSLLKRPKAELDWITTGQTPAPAAIDQFMARSTCLGEQCVLPTQMNAVQIASASPSPLQRLKALTNSDVVNHVVSQPLSSSRAAAVITTAVSLSPAVPVRVVRQTSLPHDGQMLIVRRKSASPTSSASSITSNSSVVAPAISKRRPSAQKLVSLPRPGSLDRRRSSPAASSAARTVAAPVAVRCVRSELDDHRYSTPMPPVSVERPCHPRSSSSVAKPSRPGRSSVDGRCPSRRPSVTVNSRSLSTSSAASSSSSVLEMLLRTSKRLRPNAGSDALMTACRGGVPGKRPTPSRRRVDPAPASRVDATRTQSNPPATTFTTFHDSLLADLTGSSASKGDAAAVDQSAAPAVNAVQASTVPPSAELLSPVSDCFTLFSEHLLSDSQGVIDVGMLSDDQHVWTPSRLDDKVISNELEEIMREQVRQDDTWLQQYLSELL